MYMNPAVARRIALEAVEHADDKTPPVAPPATGRGTPDDLGVDKPAPRGGGNAEEDKTPFDANAIAERVRIGAGSQSFDPNIDLANRI